MHSEILTALVVPGWTTRRRRGRLAWGLMSVGIGLPLAVLGYVAITDRNGVALGLDAAFLLWVVIVGTLAIAARGVALAEVWFARDGADDDERPERTRRDRAALGAAVVALLAASVGIVEVGRARASIAPVFAIAGDGALYDADAPVDDADVSTTPDAAQEEPAGTAPATTSRPRSAGTPSDDIPTVVLTTPPAATLPPKPTRPDSGVGPSELADVTTVLLLGGDAGPGRAGLRTDTMILFSVHRPSGRAALISIPRDLRRLLFPPGSALEARHPYGYDDIANAVYPDVSVSRSLRDAYHVEGVRPGVVAIAQAIGYSFDVTIHDYVLVDMQGFLDLVDAVGGVTVRVDKALPMPGNVPGARTQYPDVIGPGTVRMDGTTALGFARSRYADSDYHRTRRQRQLLAALARQIDLADVALSFGSVASAVGGTLRTSLTPDELVATLNVIGGETAIVESVGLVPPLVNVRRPDYDRLAKVVGAVQLALVTGQPSGY